MQRKINLLVRIKVHLIFSDLVGQLTVKGSTTKVFAIVVAVVIIADSSNSISHSEMAFDCCSNAVSKGRTSTFKKSML